MSAHDRSEHAATTYLEQQVRGEDPVALIARVYEMAAVQIARARSAMTAEDWAAKGRAVNKASRCLSLLQCSLDLEQGGEVAANLDRLYGYLLRRLGDAHLRNDDDVFAEVLRHLRELGGAWREAARRGARPEPPALETAPEAPARAAVGG